MAKIVTTQTFRDGYDTFEEGQEYDVSLGRAARFVALGWATTAEEIEGLDPVKIDANPVLDVQDVNQGSTSQEA